MRKKHVILSCGDEYEMASLSLEQVDAINTAPPENAEMATRQAICDSLNNAVGNPEKWTLSELAKRFDVWDIRELMSELQTVCRMVDVGEAAASELTVSKSSLAW